ncbi:hypothetical protein Goshw_020016, partial [Gossypium schwendimanii]|nr:hypothetical protein [Gossypium schwendimanii]
NTHKLLPPFAFAPTTGLASFQPGEAQKCWSALSSIQGCILQISTYWPRLISCSSPTPPVGPILNGINKVSPPLFTIINGCIMEIFNSLSGGQMFTIISPACCNAIMKLNDVCWPKLFPFYPNFSLYLKNYCGGTTEAPK